MILEPGATTTLFCRDGRHHDKQSAASRVLGPATPTPTSQTHMITSHSCLPRNCWCHFHADASLSAVICPDLCHHRRESWGRELRIGTRQGFGSGTPSLTDSVAMIIGTSPVDGCHHGSSCARCDCRDGRSGLRLSWLWQRRQRTPDPTTPPRLLYWLPQP